MRKAFLAGSGAMLMLIGSGAISAEPAPSPPPAAALVGGADFISPAGEPVHSPDQLSGAEHWFERADADHDGRLTRAEFVADARRFFAVLDSDHDGQIGPVEIEHYETVIAPEIAVGSTGVTIEGSSDDSSAPAQPPYPDRLGAGRYGYIDLPEPIVSADENFDRAISAAEFDHTAIRRFAQLDTNADGAITRDELPRLKAADGDGHRRHKRER